MSNALDFYDDVVSRLASLGYTTLAADEDALVFAIESVVESVLNTINHAEVPQGLRYAVIDMIAGSFLQKKKATGNLDESGIDVELIASDTKEGDTQVKLAGMSPSQAVDALIDHLIDARRGELYRYRKLVW